MFGADAVRSAAWTRDRGPAQKDRAADLTDIPRVSGLCTSAWDSAIPGASSSPSASGERASLLGQAAPHLKNEEIMLVTIEVGCELASHRPTDGP